MKKLVTFFLLLALVLCTFSTSFAAMGQAGPYDIAAGTEGYSPSKYASRYGASAAYSCSIESGTVQGQYRTNELVRRRMNFSSDAMADFEGLLEVNRKICQQQMAEKASPTLPTHLCGIALDQWHFRNSE